MFCGADTEQMRRLSQRMEQTSEHAADLLVALSVTVRSVPWEGVDAQRFQQEFRDPVTDGWGQMVQRLRDSAAELGEHADQQDRTSEGASDPGVTTTPAGSVVPTSWGDDRGSGGADVPVTAEAGRDGAEGDGPPNPDGTITGPDPYPGNGLGPGVPGTSADSPEPPAWEPADSGSGAWDSREPTQEDRDNRDLAEDLVLGGRFTGKGAASDNLEHYLDNTGEDMAIDVDDMIEEVPEFSTAVSEQRSSIGQEAISQAQQSGATGPVTFPVNTDWEGGQASKSESEKYFYATGSFDYNQTGTVTAYPPDDPGGDWTYEVDTAVNLRDRYNWDTGKGVNIDVPDWVPGYPDEINVSDTQMQGLHQSGLAREYNIVGASERSTHTGP